MKKPQFTIKQPCYENLDAMPNCGNGNKFCNTCQKKIFNITTLNKEAITQLYQANNGNLCVIAKPEQLTPNKRQRLLKKIGMLAAIVTTALFTQSLQAQEHKNYKIKQTETTTDSITISGVLKSKEIRLHHKTKAKRYDGQLSITIYNNNTEIITKEVMAENGVFSLTISKNGFLGSTFTIEINNSLTIEDIPVKNTRIKGTLEEHYVTGRFF